MNHIVIPLNAFNRLEVLEKGQAAFIPLIAMAGAFGVEIRRELIQRGDNQFAKIKNELDQYQLFTVYSTPVECWRDDFQLNVTELTQVFQEAFQLGVKWIKVSLGHFHPDHSNVLDLREFLSPNHGIELLIENDQTVYGGNIRSMKAFFEKATIHDVPVDMTFDVGNWFFSGQDVEEALHELSSYVKYLHLKQVGEHEEGLVTLPLDFVGNHSWINVMKCFPAELVKGLEFPIEPKESAKKYIDSVTQLSVAR